MYLKCQNWVTFFIVDDGVNKLRRHIVFAQKIEDVFYVKLELINFGLFKYYWRIINLIVFCQSLYGIQSRGENLDRCLLEV